MSKTISIAIDGPSGAGKSTIARAAAEHFGYIYVDTGALYRTLGLGAVRNNIDISDTDAVKAFLPTVHVEMKHAKNDGHRMYLNGDDVTGEIRYPEISQAASKISAIPCVREHLLQMQRDMAEKYDVIMDGRDIGTVVLPNADIKIFLTASLDDRAKRRYDELIEKGMDVTYPGIYEDMKKRDEQDSSRAVAPLKPAEDAVLVDTSGNTLQESIDIICSVIEQALEKTRG